MINILSPTAKRLSGSHRTTGTSQAGSLQYMKIIVQEDEEENNINNDNNKLQDEEENIRLNLLTIVRGTMDMNLMKHQLFVRIST